MTDKEDKFCHEYIKDYNKKQAAIRAGYSKRSARQQGSDLYAKQHIKDRIAELQNNVVEQLEITNYRNLRQLKGIAFSNITDYMTDWGVFKKLEELTEEQRAAINEFTITETAHGRAIKLKLHDKLKAIDKLEEALKESQSKEEIGKGVENELPTIIIRRRGK